MEHRDDQQRDWDATTNDDLDTTTDAETHATTGGAAAAGAVTGGVVGLTGGPIGAAVGAVGGAIVGAAAERIMHHDNDDEVEHVPTDREVGLDATTSDRERMQLREEELHARTTSTQTGEVRVNTDGVSEQRTVEVPVTREEVFVDRQPVDRRPSDQPISESEHGSIEVPVREEQVTVEKRPVVYEEVGIGKRQVEETRDVNATVRREELRVQEQGDAHLRDSDEHTH
jgi:uncharacterized protein (TIGR02271 family)